MGDASDAGSWDGVGLHFFSQSVLEQVLCVQFGLVPVKGLDVISSSVGSPGSCCLSSDVWVRMESSGSVFTDSSSSWKEALAMFWLIVSIYRSLANLIVVYYVCSPSASTSMSQQVCHDQYDSIRLPFSGVTQATVEIFRALNLEDTSVHRQC